MENENIIKKIFNILSSEEKEKYLGDMSKYQRDIINNLLNDDEKGKNYSLNDLVFDFDEYFINKVLEIEINEYLKGNSENNKRNGYTKGIEIQVGERKININRPRLRNEKNFDSSFIPKRTKIFKDLRDNIILLYSKNNSVNDIKDIIKTMFKIEIGTTFISTVVQTISDEVLEWRNRELKRCYFTINIDCTYITIRDHMKLGSHKIPVYIAIGTTLSGHKEIVGMYLGNEDEKKNIIDEYYDKDIGESKTFWLTVFNDLKDRGVEKVLFLVSDGITGMKEAVEDEFPGTVYQRCVVHLDRNLQKYTDKNISKDVLKDFKKIYTAVTLQDSQIEYESFIEKYSKKKTIVKKASEYYEEYIKQLFNVPENIRKYIYTNNIVESANSKVKRGFYGRGALPNAESAINIIYLNLKDLEEKWLKNKVTNWDKISTELMTLYLDQIKEYL